MKNELEKKQTEFGFEFKVVISPKTSGHFVNTLQVTRFFPLILCRDIMNNKVFYQHPNLMRILGMHETVMEVMVNVLGGDKSQVLHLF